MTILATGIAFITAVLTIVGVLAHEREIAEEAKRLYTNTLKKKRG